MIDTEAETYRTALLTHLHRGGSWAYWWTNPGKRSTWWTVNNPAPIPDNGTNVYFGVHPSNKEKNANERATIQDVAAINCLFADFDGKDFDNGKTGALARVDALDPPPSVVIDSGGGYHCYWLLQQPFTLTTPTKRERAKSVQARWVARVGSDPGSKDIAHVLRVPGTRNLKPQYGPDFPTVLIIRCDLDRLYELDALEALLPPETERTPVQIPFQDDTGRWAEAAFKGELATLAGTTEGARNDQLNKSAYSLGQIIGNGSLDQAQVEQALYATARGIGLGENEALATIRSGIEAGTANPRGPKEGTKRQKSRPIGARIPSDEARGIEAIAPETPDPALRQSIIDALLETYKTPEGKNRLRPVLLRRQKAGRLLLTWLGEHGGFVQGVDENRFYFYRPEPRLYNLDSDHWAAWLYALTGANPASTDYAHLLADCKAAAMNAPRRNIVRVSTWDDEHRVLRVSRFDGTVYVLDGESITEEANGENALFYDDSLWQPYRPDFDGSGGVFFWHTSEFPNWKIDQDGEQIDYGLALRAWSLGTFFTELCPTRPMAAMIGEKGSGKTLTWRLKLRFLFGPLAEVSGVPNKPDGFTAAAAAAHLLVLDNLDQFTGWLRDKLARLSTGGVDEYRRLYSNNEVGRVRYRCWLGFTSRTPDTLRRDDLADRLILLPVERLPDDMLQAERDFLAQADLFRNEWWADVLGELNQVVAAIRRGELRSKSTLRMADWESLGRLVAQVEGATTRWDTFIENLTKQQAAFLLEENIIVDGLNIWMSTPENHGREMTSRDLYRELKELLFGKKEPSDDWPKSVIAFGQKLAGMRRELRTMWDVKWKPGTETKTRGRIVYQFWKEGEGQLRLKVEETSP